MNKEQEVFEIHITGVSNKIIEEFKKDRVKTLEVELLDMHGNIVGKEYMCSLRKHFDDYEQCKAWTLDYAKSLTNAVVRVKIESPVIQKYIDMSIYAEAHYRRTSADKPFDMPTVRNVGSDKLVSTERTYNKDEYNQLFVKYNEVEYAETELCLYDSSTSFDDKWLSYYAMKKQIVYTHTYKNRLGNDVRCYNNLSAKELNYKLKKQKLIDFRTEVRNENGVGVYLNYSNLTLITNSK